MEQIKEFLGQMKLYLRFDMAVCDKLDDFEARIYKLEEDNKRLVTNCRSLEKKYSELLYAFSSFKKDSLSTR